MAKIFPYCRIELNKYIEQYIDDRIDEIGIVFRAEERIKALFEQYDALFDQLLKSIPDESKRLLIQYNDMSNEISGCIEEFFYQFGMQDSFVIQNFDIGSMKVV